MPMKLTLAILALLAMVGCGIGSTGDTPGPVDPTANNAEAQKKKTEDAISKAPPELRDKIRASVDQSMRNAGGAPPPVKK